MLPLHRSRYNLHTNEAIHQSHLMEIEPCLDGGLVPVNYAVMAGYETLQVPIANTMTHAQFKAMVEDPLNVKTINPIDPNSFVAVKVGHPFQEAIKLLVEPLIRQPGNPQAVITIKTTVGYGDTFNFALTCTKHEVGPDRKHAYSLGLALIGAKFLKPYDNSPSPLPGRWEVYHKPSWDPLEDYCDSVMVNVLTLTKDRSNTTGHLALKLPITTRMIYLVDRLEGCVYVCHIAKARIPLMVFLGTLIGHVEKQITGSEAGRAFLLFEKADMFTAPRMSAYLQHGSQRHRLTTLNARYNRTLQSFPHSTPPEWIVYCDPVPQGKYSARNTKQQLVTPHVRKQNSVAGYVLLNYQPPQAFVTGFIVHTLTGKVYSLEGFGPKIALLVGFTKPYPIVDKGGIASYVF